MLSENEVINLIGTPSEIEDYGQSGKFIHYENILG